jgi:GGDEF domain-containing protein
MFTAGTTEKFSHDDPTLLERGRGSDIDDEMINRRREARLRQYRRVRDSIERYKPLQAVLNNLSEQGLKRQFVKLIESAGEGVAVQLLHNSVLQQNGLMVLGRQELGASFCNQLSMMNIGNIDEFKNSLSTLKSFCVVTDIANLGPINEQYGREGGNDALTKAAKILIQIIESIPDAKLSWLGGDEAFIEFSSNEDTHRFLAALSVYNATKTGTVLDIPNSPTIDIKADILGKVVIGGYVKQNELSPVQKRREHVFHAGLILQMPLTDRQILKIANNITEYEQFIEKAYSWYKFKSYIETKEIQNEFTTSMINGNSYLYQFSLGSQDKDNLSSLICNSMHYSPIFLNKRVQKQIDDGDFVSAAFSMLVVKSLELSSLMLVDTTGFVEEGEGKIKQINPNYADGDSAIAAMIETLEKESLVFMQTTYPEMTPDEHEFFSQFINKGMLKVVAGGPRPAVHYIKAVFFKMWATLDNDSYSKNAITTACECYESFLKYLNIKAKNDINVDIPSKLQKVQFPGFARLFEFPFAVRTIRITKAPEMSSTLHITALAEQKWNKAFLNHCLSFLDKNPTAYLGHLNWIISIIKGIRQRNGDIKPTSKELMRKVEQIIEHDNYKDNVPAELLNLLNFLLNRTPIYIKSILELLTDEEKTNPIIQEFIAKIMEINTLLTVEKLSS